LNKGQVLSAKPLGYSDMVIVERLEILPRKIGVPGFGISMAFRNKKNSQGIVIYLPWNFTPEFS
jgi:hypothetical protein